MIAVEKTDSPKREMGAPNPLPVNDSPDLRWRVAGRLGSNGFSDLGETVPFARVRMREGRATRLSAGRAEGRRSESMA